MAHASSEDTVAVVVPERWLDQFCEQVGSLCAVLQSLSKLPGHDRPHTLAGEALENCAALQDLLNAIPVWGGSVPHLAAAPLSSADWSHPRLEPSFAAVDDRADADELGDSFPEFLAGEDEQLPIVDQQALEERYEQDSGEMLHSLERFCQRSEGDLRQLELLSVGHDWLRLSRLAGALKDAAAHASATRIVVDASALQGAARVGCRNDVDLALDALRADLRACVQQVQSWLATGTVR